MRKEQVISTTNNNQMEEKGIKARGRDDRRRRRCDRHRRGIHTTVGIYKDFR